MEVRDLRLHVCEIKSKLMRWELFRDYNKLQYYEFLKLLKLLSQQLDYLQ